MPCQLKTMSPHLKRSASDIETPDCYPIESFRFGRGNLPSLSSYMKRMKIYDNDNQRSSRPEFCSPFSSDRSDYGSYNYSSGYEQTSSDHIANVSSSSSSSSSSSLSSSSARQVLLNVESIFRRDENGNNQLHKNILQRNTNAALNLIKQAPSFDYISIENGEDQTALHLAVITDQPTLVRSLICAGAAVDAVDINSKTALHLACELGHKDAVRHLLRPVEYKETLDNKYTIPFQRIPQNMRLTDASGKTCLDLAVKNKKFEVIKLLIDSGAFMMPPDIETKALNIINSRHINDDSSSDEDNDDGDDDDSEEEEAKQDTEAIRCRREVSSSEVIQQNDNFSFFEHEDYLSDTDLSIILKRQ